MGAGRLRQIVAYGRNVYDLQGLLETVRDRRHCPRVAAAQVAAAVFFCGLLRIRSFNALEPKLYEKPFVRLAGAAADAAKLCSVDTLSRALRATEIETVWQVCAHMIAAAERKKVFREGWHGALRYVALDGWEPIQSLHRHCGHCLVRKVSVKQRDGSLAERDQYYHRYVVAMLIDRRMDLVVDFEPLLPFDLRGAGITKSGEDEGELTAAKRLLRRVKEHHGWLDVVIGDSLYANGPFLSLVKELRMGAVLVARKAGDEPLKEALSLWQGQPPDKTVRDEQSREEIQLWDCPGVETLDSYQGPIRVVRGRVRDLRDASGGSPKTWCVVVTGKAGKLPMEKVVAVARSRWHIENTGFHQWSTRWCFAHVFAHNAHAILALYCLFFAAYNLLTLFLYRQLCCYGRDRGKDPTRTICRLIDEMLDDLARLQYSPWDTS